MVLPRGLPFARRVMIDGGAAVHSHNELHSTRDTRPPAIITHV
jgi:hypothetical protein